MSKNTKNIPYYIIGKGSFSELENIIIERFKVKNTKVLYFIDHFFCDGFLEKRLPQKFENKIIYVDTTDEPKTTVINNIYNKIKDSFYPDAVVGIGGGSTMDTAKAISNLLTNGGIAENYQGWDLVKKPGIYKIGIPTLSGTGSEASKTCVMINHANGLKLGMNSDFTLFDQLILDPDLTRTVPRDQYFYTGMDTYIHCIESLNGSFRHQLSDVFAISARDLCLEIFLSDDMMSDENREKMMIASYLGGCAIANSFVGVIHPVSAGLSIVLDFHHGIGNCISLNALAEFYPEENKLFKQMMQKQKIQLPSNICKDLSEKDFELLYSSSIIHEKPLENALGPDFKNILTKEKMKSIFLGM